MDYGMTVHTSASFTDVVARVRDALKAQGFGVLTEIDVRAFLERKHYAVLVAGSCRLAAPGCADAWEPQLSGMRFSSRW